MQVYEPQAVEKPMRLLRNLCHTWLNRALHSLMTAMWAQLLNGVHQALETTRCVRIFGSSSRVCSTAAGTSAPGCCVLPTRSAALRRLNCRHCR